MKKIYFGATQSDKFKNTPKETYKSKIDQQHHLFHQILQGAKRNCLTSSLYAIKFKRAFHNCMITITLFFRKLFHCTNYYVEWKGGQGVTALCSKFLYFAKNWCSITRVCIYNKWMLIDTPLGYGISLSKNNTTVH